MDGADVFQFDRADYADDEAAFRAYVRLYANGADARRTAGPFEASVHAIRFDKLLLFERRLSGAGFHRQDRVGGDGFDHFTLTHLLAGRIEVEADTRAFTLRPGEAVLLDMRRRMTTSADRAHFVTVSLPRETVASAVGAPGRLHGHRFGAEAFGLAGDFLRSLAARGDGLADDARARIAGLLAEMLRIAAGRSVNAWAAQEMGEAAEAYIVRHARDPALTAERVAEALGVSRATLYRQFQGTGGVARRIDLQRLGGMRLRLEAGDPGPLEDLAREAGFADAAAARRAFRRIYGVEADAFRAAALTDAADPVERSRLRWLSWMSEL